MDRIPLGVLLFLCSFAILLAAPAHGAEKPSCAFLWLHVDEGATEISEYQGKELTNRFTQALDLLDVYDVVPSAEMSRTIAMRKGLGAAPCTNLPCAVEYGKLLNADYVIYGIYGHIGNVYSIETILVDVENSQEIKHVVTDYKGDHPGFTRKVPLENLKTLLGMPVLPPGVEASYARLFTEDSAPEKTVAGERPLRYGLRLGLVSSDDGVEFGGGIELRYNHLSFKIMGNDVGIGGALSYYLNVRGNSPYMSLVGAYYDKKHKGARETGNIYGLLLGYRLQVISEKTDICIGLGGAYVDWDHKTFDSDQEFIPVGELTLGYMF
jgi:hypothetical protein